MSLAIDDDRRRGHSRSRSRDQRSQEEPPREQSKYPEIREPSYIYPEDELDDRYKSSRRRNDAPKSNLPYPAEGGGMDSMLPGSQSLYSYAEDTRPIYRTASPPKELPYRNSKVRDNKEEDAHLPGAFPEDDQPKKDSGDERRSRYPDDYDPRYGKYEKSGRDSPRTRQADPPYDRYDKNDVPDDKLKYLPQKYSRRYEDDVDTKKKDRRSKKEREEEDLAYGAPPPAPLPPKDAYSSYGPGSYMSGAHPDSSRPSRYVDDEDDPRLRPISPKVDEPSLKKSHRDSPREGHRSSKSLDISTERRKYSDSDRDDYDYDSKKSYKYSYREDDRDSKSKSSTLAVESSSHSQDRSRDRRRDKSPAPPTLMVESEPRDRDRSRDRRGNGRDKSPLPPSGHRTSLSVDTGRMHLSLASAPGSPMLESYHGTYQDCSPMPSPLILASRSPGPDDLKSIETLSPLNSDGEGSKKLNRRARFHDPEDIASRLAQALKGTHAPKIEPLVEILPSLTHEQVMELRAEYKQIVKTGSDRKGVNIAKHIRARLKDEDPILMKACYAVALGKWESESYWANFWYQGDKTRRELLIESLMGRTNDEIRRIKDSFTDKKYDNSLTKCMKTELKEDKFKKAVLMVLDESRMEEYDYHGRKLPIDFRQVDDDVSDLRKAIKSDKGGETLMISIVVQRSESHLRAVLQEYEQKYRANFAREALKKSGNLVGELLAHVLNGVINRPVRDALLLNHALTSSRKDQLRRELLISRLVRFHWEPAHMQDVKKAYRERYGQDLQDAVKEATSGEWGLFCRELCIARMPNHVRRIERVERVEIIR
ncbi:Annexin A11-like protein [Cladobotryum mycophilum]|uniref:Annexin A11-like protein n=1 Tax=Cladobotryum mycophilum TaxID=491253 RepID=A0ABR0SFT5_9HYPO